MTNEERIKADAQRYTKDEGYQKVYIAGATAESEFTKKAMILLKIIVSRFQGAAEMADQDYDKGLMTKCRNLIEQWKGKDQAKAKEGIIRVILAGAYDVSKDAASAEEYLKSEGVDVSQVKANAQYFTWKAELIRITKDKTGESNVKINDEEAVKWYNDGFTPEQTFRETWQSDGD